MSYTRKERAVRSAMLFSDAKLDVLWHSHVMIFGLGGVGSYAAEALCRAGIGRLTLVDADVVAVSNLNRQLPALCSTIGRPKAEVVRERLLDIAPDAQIEAVQAFHLPDFPVPIPDSTAFVVDAVDTVAAKLDLAETCMRREIPLVSCMGMGNRLDPTKIHIGDVFKTTDCPLCRVMRRELRRREISALRCVYSTEKARESIGEGSADKRQTGRSVPGSVAYVPAVAGLYMAYETVRRLCEDGTIIETERKALD